MQTRYLGLWRRIAQSLWGVWASDVRMASGVLLAREAIMGHVANLLLVLLACA